jgi:hypothetical protein
MSADGYRVSIPLRAGDATRALIVLAILSFLATGCGSSVGGSSPASADVDQTASGASGTCPAVVLDALRHVAIRVYNEGVVSERTAAAVHYITRSSALREAVEHNDSGAARAAAQALVATGHMTSLTVLRNGQTLAEAGSPNALAPLRGPVPGATGAPVGSFVTSVWSDAGFIAEMQGVAEGDVALREGSRSIAGSLKLPSGELPPAGTFTEHGVPLQYTSFPAAVYPSGSLRVYLVRPVRSTTGLCGRTPQDTLINTISRIARLIYAGEAGGRALIQVHRVQHDPALLSAVARRDPAATRTAIEGLLNQHIVRLRVSAGGRLLGDVGGPYVLAPVRAALRLNGRQIGNLVLSIQDDEGYLRLTKRLAGLRVLMYMRGSELVKNSLGPAPGTVPASGRYQYRGHTFDVFTLDAQAFPSGPLTIHVLIPIPYS